MTLEVIAALDVSLTSTGICYGTNADDWNTIAVKSTNRGDDVVSRVKRYEAIVERVDGILAVVRPKLILIEGYSFGSKNGRHEAMAELGGLIRWHATEYTPHVLEVAPTTLKKFTTGKGAGDKALIQAHVQKRWGQIFASNDEADAFCLFHMALCIAERQEAETQPQREAVKTVLSKSPATGQQIALFCQGGEKPF